jgi:hypothetical protein
MSYHLVDADSELSWSFDWTDYLDYASPPDEIVSRQWTICPQDGSPVPNLTTATGEVVIVTGLVAGHVYRLSERIVTEAGLTDERTIVLRAEHT